jgi:hypothetical protein
MLAARKQAEDYARALPVEHGYPPFLLVVDIGHVIEVYADFSGQGKNYAHFPDRQSYRLGLNDLREKKVSGAVARDLDRSVVTRSDTRSGRSDARHCRAASQDRQAIGGQA